MDHASFIVDAVLFDMDGTLVDSIAAVESSWAEQAILLGMSPEEVIAATHGKRAIDNLRELKPHLRRLTAEQMEEHVEEFEKGILRAADEFGIKVKSRRSSSAGSSRRGSSVGSRRASSSSGANPLLAHGGLFGLSKIATPAGADSPRHQEANGNLEKLTQKLSELKAIPTTEALDSPFDDDEDDEIDDPYDFSDYTEEEIGCTNKSVKILPGVARLIGSLPAGRFAVATSGAKTYCHGALLRAGIQRPKVTITADDPRLKKGKPAPDPFLLAASELGYDIKKCVVFEDSPSGIIAGVASGAVTIAVCTSHEANKISHVGAHYIVPSIDHVFAIKLDDGRIKIVIDAHPLDHPLHGRKSCGALPTPIAMTIAV